MAVEQDLLNAGASNYIKLFLERCCLGKYIKVVNSLVTQLRKGRIKSKMKVFGTVAFVSLIASVNALPAWFGEVPHKIDWSKPESSDAYQSPAYQNSSVASTTSSSSTKYGVYTLPYTPTSTPSHSFVYESTLYGPTGPHTHHPFSIPKIYTDVETSAPAITAK